jgi:O-antigen/teichoic acid export membrane protein
LAVTEQIARASGGDIAKRALTAVVATGSRHFFVVLSGIIIARGLGPVQYGNYSFLLAGFTTLHTLIDLCTSQAFYTFACRETWPLRRFLLYCGWVGLQFAVPFAVMALLIPHALFDEIWRGQPRNIVLLAFAASFAQRVLWQMVMQVYESRRLTVRVQLATVAIMATYLVVCIILFATQFLSIASVLAAMAVEFFIVGIAMLTSLLRSAPADTEEVAVRAVLKQFATFVFPLILPLILQSLNSLGETWLLQIFGGPREQGYFNIAQQYANIGLVFGFSATNVFWKEFAAAHARRDDEAMHAVYVNSSRILFIAAALVAGFGIFWTTPIIVFLLGERFAPAGPVFAITLLNSVFQCFGIIMSSTFLATARTKAWSRFGVMFASASVVGSIVALWLLRLGAIGLAAKLCFLSAIFTIAYDLYICRAYGWKTDNMFRISAGLALLAVGALSYELVHMLIGGQPLAVRLIVGLVLYGMTAGVGVILLMRRLGYWQRVMGLMRRGA